MLSNKSKSETVSETPESSQKIPLFSTTPASKPREQTSHTPRSIIAFFVEAATRKGATQVQELVFKGQEFCNWESRRNYRIEYANENFPDVTFTIYHSGLWAFDSKDLVIEGKQAPVHSKTWVRRLVHNGVDYPFAMSEWSNYDAFSRGERDNP